MANIVLKGNTSGSITIASPDVSGVNVLTLPVETGTILTTNTPLPEVSSVEFAGAGTSSGNITITAPDTDETNTLTFPETTGTFATENSLGMRNLIINGNMAIAQRATSITGITSAGYYTCDRWNMSNTTAGTWTQTQDTDVPTGQGFASSLKLDCTTADASLAAGDQLGLETRLEGLNCQQLEYGTATAKSTTLSFWVKSNKTGVYTFEYFQSDSSRSISQTYTISVADTWEKKTITIDGDTSGIINNDNGLGLLAKWWLAAGTSWSSGTLATSWATLSNPNRVSSSNVNLADSTSNYINVTGVQLEVGTTATPFENLQYGQQLALCQRYYERIVNTVAQSLLGDTYANTAGSPVPTINVSFKQTKRAAPTMALVGTFTQVNTAGGQNIFAAENTMSAFYLTAAVGRAYFFPLANSGWSADSEL